MAVLEDITRDLHSLQFESSLQDGEKNLLHLRTRSLAVVSSACAQAAYFVAILNKLKKNLFENINKPSSNSSNHHPIKVGIIGCGRLGKQIATVLLELGHVNPCDLFISTRCPENLEQFASKGVLCCFDNKMVSSKVDVLFLCCLPSQLHIVAKELRGNLDCMVYSFIGGMSLAKISQLLDYQQIIKPNFTFSPDIHENPQSTPWQFGRTITETLQDPACSAETCPLNSCEEESVLVEDVELCQLFVFAFLNQCTTLGVEKREAIRLCNLVMFGLEEDQSSCLAISDILPHVENKTTCGNKSVFPMFDLVKLTLGETPAVEKKLSSENENLREAFITKYRDVLQN